MSRRLRLLLVGLFGLGLVAGLGSTLGGSAPVVDLQPAADLSQFNPGMIISDAVFYNATTMTADQVQAFLVAKGSGLAGMHFDTWTRSGDTRCGGYQGAAQESAAWIIYKVGQACGINPEVLLVTLQKEQALVTDGSISSDQLRKAMGYGCPDTPAGCDATYNGFYNQLYMAAHQFKNYQANPTKYGYVAGRTNSIPYYPNNPGCGSASVYIQNQATAGLYNYTPYVPNRAALNAGYGKGDACSSYGNRNFYNYFNDWFNGAQAIGYRASRNDLGQALSGVLCDQAGGGCRQRFNNGDIYWSAATGAFAVKGAILATYYYSGGPAYMGYPIAEEGQDGNAPGTYYSNFEAGDIIWAQSTGAHMVRGELLKEWRAWGAAGGALGLPIGDSTAVAGGAVNQFQNGSIYWSSATGAHGVTGAILAKYVALGGPAYMGFPMGEPGQDGNAPGTYYSNFQAGDIIWTQGTGAHAVRGELLKEWRAWGAAGGALGLPVGDSTALSGGALSAFQGGTVYWSAGTGAHAVRGAILTKYEAVGGPSDLGFPLAEEGQDTRVPGVYYSNFERGDIIWAQSTGAHTVKTELLKGWRAWGAAGGALGLPIADSTAIAGGALNQFQYGTVYWSGATGAHGVTGDILAKYVAIGGPGELGFPTGEPGQDGNAPGVWYSTFERGNIIWAQSTGAHVVRGAVSTAWVATGASAGPLGLLVGDYTAAAGGGYADFQNGSIYWSSATGAHTVTGDILTKYRALGGPAFLGFPLREQAQDRQTPVVTSSGFQNGDIVWSQATGAHFVRGGIRQAWQGAGGSSGYLGAPVADEVALSGGGYVSDFQGGSIYWSAATSMHIVRGGAVLDKYKALGGPASGLGYPTADYVAVPSMNAAYTNFQGGDLIWSQAAGAHYVRGGILRTWQAAGGAAGYLGFPTADEVALPDGGYVSDFQGGSIYWSAATSMHIVRGTVLDKYKALGGPASGLGYPTADYVAVPSMNAAYTNFQGGDLIWSQAAGAHYVRGGILRTWLWAGGAAGYLGFPTADEVALPDGGYVSDFQGGSIYWSAATSMHIVRGAVLDKYKALGGPSSALGYPTRDQVATSGRTGSGVLSSFQGGAIYWSSGTGAHWLPTSINQAYVAAGGTSSSYGYPTGDPVAVTGGQRVDFQRGSITR